MRTMIASAAFWIVAALIAVPLTRQTYGPIPVPPA